MVSSDTPGAVSILNHPPVRLPGPSLLHELVHHGNEPSSVAIDGLLGDGTRQQLSYAELHHAADLLALEILRSVPAPTTSRDFVVPLLIHQGPSLYVAMLAVLKAGGGFCPLQLDAPSERIMFIIDDVGADLVLAAPDLTERIPSAEAHVKVLPVSYPSPSPTTPLDTSCLTTMSRSSDSLAYVMYTSGSTGKPKGVGVSHDAATQSLLAHDPHIPDFDRFLQFASPTFDVSIFEIFFPLLRGRTLVTCDRATMLDDLPSVIGRMDVDACELTPTVAGSLLRSREAVPTLRLLLTIGEMLTDQVVSEFGGDDNRSSILWGMYGPTEAAIHCTLQTSFPVSSSPRNIGVPFDTVSCFIARIPEENETFALDLVGPGEVGELVVGGHQLARGYLNRPEQTSQSFLESAFGRLYRTGDRARLQPDGTIECLGRIADGQIKLRGQRIELGEIEHAILQTAGCRAAVAIVIDGIIVAFCVGAEAGAELLPATLSETCRKWLPAFMVPGDFICMADFPRLPSGKIDRHALKATYAEMRTAGEEHHELRSTVEDTDPTMLEMLRLVAQILERPIDENSRLSSQGLDSLKAIRLASVLREHDINTTALDILQADTLASLRSTIDRRSLEQSNQTPGESGCENVAEVMADVADIPHQEIEGAYRCTPLQSSMLFETTANKDMYRNEVVLDFPDSCSMDAAKQALLQVIQRNDILRSGFVHRRGDFVRIVYRQFPEAQFQVQDSDSLAVLPDSADNTLLPVSIQLYRPSATRGPRASLRLHHAIYDGWTVDLITQDLSTLVKGEILPSDRPQFAHVASFYNSLSSSTLDNSRAYWAEHLRDWQPQIFPRLLDSPTPCQSQSQTTYTLSITEDQVRSVADRLLCHPQAVFQAALVWIWASLLGSNDVVIGTIGSGRTIAVDGIDQIMGPCITPIPIRSNLDRVKTAANLICDIQATSRRSLEHSLLPLSEIRKTVGIQPGQPLYDVLVVYQESLYSKGRLSREVREVSHRDILETKVLVEIEPLDGKYSCHVTSHDEFIMPQHAELLAKQLGAVVERLAMQPDVLITELHESLPSEALSTYNQTPSVFDDIPDLATSFERTAQAFPESTAISYAAALSDAGSEFEDMTYAQLDRTSNQIAHYLRSLGTWQGDIIAIVMEKSILMYAAILAIVKAGCAYLPLLPSTPPDRTRMILGHASASLCLADSTSLASLKAPDDCKAVNLEEVDLSILSEDKVKRDIDGSRVAYVIYTSGTTGVPKGIAVSQLNIVSNLATLKNIYPVDGTCRMLQLCSQAFDVSVFEIFFTWTVGGCLCTGINDILYEDIERSIRLLGCTHLSLTPTVAALVRRKNVPNVRFLVTAGEPMTAPVAQEWSDLLYQGYGPAETTNICTVKRMRHGDYINHLGFAFPNTSAFVLSPESGAIMPLGAYGEFCFGGDQVALGYVGLDDVTKAKFLDHPTFGRIYRSGDMGRMLPDGSLLVTGRLDGQVKLRGQRIETGEVDTIVTTSGIAVSAASLIAQRGTASRDQLVCFYVPTRREGTSLKAIPFNPSLSQSNAQLFSHLRSALPTYMIPSFLVPITSVPLTPSGKIDKKQLRAMFSALDQSYLDTAADSQYRGDEDTDWTPLERDVAKCITESLGVPLDMLTRWLPLTAVGLDSITAIGLCRQLEGISGHRIPISALLRDPSIAQIARMMDVRKTAEPVAALPSLPADWIDQVTRGFEQENIKIDAILPCTPLQEAMLSAINSSSYTNQLILRLRSPSDTVRAGWERLLHRHGILRTCFLTTSDTRYPFAQVVLQDWPLPWTVHACEDLQQVKTRLVQQLPDALESRSPPYRLDLLETSTDTYLALTCHHALYDGVSMGILLSEMEAITRGEPVLDSVPYEPALKHMLALPASTNDFWCRTLQNFNPPQRRLTLSKEAISVVSLRPLPTSLNEVKRRAQQLGVSLLSLCQTAWAVTASLLAETEDVCFGNVMSGRTAPIQGIERLAAPCFNTIPYRVKVSKDMQMTDILRHLHQFNAEALDYQFTPLRKVKQSVPSAAHGLFDTVFLLQQPQQRLDSEIWELVEDTGSMDVPLVFELTPDVALDSITLSLHSQSLELSTGDLQIIRDAFTYILRHALDIFGARIPQRANLPREIYDGLAEIHLTKIHHQAHQHKSSPPEPDSEWGAAEQSIRRVLSKVASVPEERISRHTTIFQIGIDSISAVQAAALLRTQGFPVTTVDMIESPSCASLAQRLAQKSSTPDGAPSSESAPKTFDIAQFEEQYWPDVKSRLDTPANTESVLPCTPVQCGMLSDFVRSQGTDYFNAMTFQLPSDFESEHVLLAWIKLVQHHSILRTGFVTVDHPQITFAMIQHAPDGHPPVSCRKDGSGHLRLLEWQHQCAKRALGDLSIPPWEVVLEPVEGHVHMHLAMLHALYDAESLRRLLDDLNSILLGRDPAEAPANSEALSSILTAATQTEAPKSFWSSLALNAVLNRFPTMTPLMEATSSLQVEKTTSGVRHEQLLHQAREAGVTPQAILQAAWAWVLSAYLGESDIIFGTVLSGRSLPSTQDATIPCIVTLPVIARVGTSQIELIQQMMQYNTRLAAHQFTPLSKIQQWLGHSGSRLFDTLLVYQKSSSSNQTKRPWQTIRDEAQLNYPVSLEVEPSEAGNMQLHLSFKPSILPRQQASILLAQFDAVLDVLSQHPQEDNHLWKSRPEIYSVIPPAEPIIPSAEVLLHQFVESAAIQWPARTAVEFVTSLQGDVPESRNWTFEELNQMGNRVANMLDAHVEQAAGIVAIHFDKCPEALFSILGILKAGFSFLALDPAAPKDRKEYILRDSGAVALLIGSETLEFTPSQPVIQVTLPGLQEFSEQPLQNRRPIDENDTCYCLYTSGTTGTPKGCEITHSNAVQAMKAFQRLFHGHWNEDSRWLQFASFHFDVTVLEQYWTWSVGMALVAAPRDLILDDIAGAIGRLRITHIDLTPSLARLLNPDDVPTLCEGVFITGGEALKQEILDVWGPRGVIYNAYGPTEATIGVTMYTRVPQNGRASNIGRQFDNVGSYVLHPGTEIPVLRGAIGELCVSGKLVGKGYLNRPELTAERFPTLAGFGERVYRTGDLVRVLHDGCFEFLGRADDQVKLRGQRLELGEINHVIRTGMPSIQDAVTIVTRHGKLDKELLVSFVTTSTASRTHSAPELMHGPEFSQCRREVQRVCRDKLPGYMVPSVVLQVSQIPLSVNNKADFKALKRLFDNLTTDQLMNSPSKPSQDRSILNSVRTRLLDSVSRFDDSFAGNISLSSNLFDLGLDSISALRLCRLLKQDGMVTVTPAMVLRNPVLEDLAEALNDKPVIDDKALLRECRQNIQAFDHRSRSEVLQNISLSVGDSIEYIAPCTPLQEGMLSRTLGLEENAYLATFRLDLFQNANLDQLQSCWEKLVASHSILRTQFIQTSAGFAQVATRQKPMLWEQAESPDEEVDTIISEARDLWIKDNRAAMVSPLKFSFVKTPTRRVLAVHIFHGLYDGNSLELMFQWITKEYHGQNHPGAPKFLDIMPYGPARNFQHTQSFWQSHLEKCSFDLQPKLPNKTESSVSSATARFPIQKLAESRKLFNVTLQSLILSVWSVVFSRRISSHASFGVVCSGRSLDLDETENIIGPLFNTLPFYPDATDLTWRGLIERCHDFNTATTQFQHAPLRDIQKWCNKGHAIFNSLFVYHGQSKTTVHAPSLWSLTSTSSEPDYPLAFEATIDEDRFLRVDILFQAVEAQSLSAEDILQEFSDIYTSLVSEVSSVRGMQLAPVSGATSTAALTPQTLDSLSPSPPAASTGQSTPEHKAAEFKLSDAARKLRDEIATFAKVPQEQVTPNTSLFELGLDSVDLVALSSRLRNVGLQVTMPQLMKSSNVAHVVELTVVASSSKSAVGDPGFDGLKSDLWKAVKKSGWDMTNVETVLPPTPLQESMVAEMLESGFERYFNHATFNIDPATDLQRLAAAWHEVIQKSPVLRTVFRQIEDVTIPHTFCQVIMRDPMVRIDQRHLAAMNDLDDVITNQKQRAMIGNGASGLLQVCIAQVGTKAYLVLSIAHALYDGWSLALLHQDLTAAYHNTLRSRPTPEAALRLLLQPHDSKAHDFWTQYLRGASPALIRRRQSYTNDKLHGAEKTSTMTSMDVLSFCRDHRITLQTLGQSVWACVLAAHLKKLDVSFGAVLSGRETEDMQSVMFPTMNTVAVRSVLHGSRAAFLQYMQSSSADIYQHQTYPLRRAPMLSEQPTGKLFNTMFLLQRQPPADVQTPSLLEPVSGEAATDFAICAELEVVESSLHWRVTSQDEFCSQDESEVIVQQMDEILRAFVADADSALLSYKDDTASVAGVASFRPGEEGSSSEKHDGPDADYSDDGSPWTQRELLVRSALSEVSGIPEDSIRKSNTPYQLGLDSISVIKVASLLRGRGVRLTVRALLATTSIVALAAQADMLEETPVPSKETESTVLERISIPDVLEKAHLSADCVQDVLPALPFQVYMMTTWQNSGGNVFYPSFHYRLRKQISREELTSVWAGIVANDPLLRTCLLPTGRQDIPFVQAIMNGSLSGPHTEVGDEITPPSASESACWPLVRLFGRKSTDGSWNLRLQIHHALYDGVSLASLVSRLEVSLLEVDGTNVPTNIPMPRLSAWKTLCYQHFSDTAVSERKAFWTKYMDGQNDSKQGVATTRQRLGSRTSLFDPNGLRGIASIEAACAKHGVGLSSLLFAAIAKILHEQEGSHGDVILGLYLANRTEDLTAEDAALPKLNLLPCRVSVDRHKDIFDLARTIQEDVLEITSSIYSTTGLWEIKDWTGVEVDVFVNFLNLPGDSQTPGILERLDSQANNDSLVPDSLGPNHVDSPWFFNNQVRDAFPEALDIEASVQDGSLAMGIFGSEARVSLSDAKALLGQIAQTLRPCGGLEV